MKKEYLLFLLVFLIIPFVYADITITTDQQIYNIGNKIKASASILREDDFEGLFKLVLSCRDYKLSYFLTPVSLESNFRTAISVPDLNVIYSMQGNCTITGDLLTNDNVIIEKKDSDSFSVTNQLSVLPVNSKIESLPGEAIQLIGIINQASGNNVLKALIKITLGNNSYNVDALEGKFNLTIKLSRNIKSGNHIIELSASDSKGNFGFSSVELEITAVPNYIKTDLNEDKLLPGSKIEIISSIYDQADDLINASLDLELTSPSGNKIFRKEVQSNAKINYEFSQYTEPGSYLLVSNYKSLLTQALINITAIREVRVKYENETVSVENIGNIPFGDELTLILESEKKKYPITKKIIVEPGKILSIDLSKEVPSGVYDVIFPIKQGLEPIREKINETIQDVIVSTQGGIANELTENNSILADNITIHDNRPAYKKIVTGFASISGAIVGADGILAKNPLIAPMILVILVLLIIFRYGRKPIMRLIRGKKDDDKDK